MAVVTQPKTEREQQLERRLKTLQHTLDQTVDAAQRLAGRIRHLPHADIDSAVKEYDSAMRKIAMQYVRGNLTTDLDHLVMLVDNDPVLFDHDEDYSEEPWRCAFCGIHANESNPMAFPHADWCDWMLVIRYLREHPARDVLKLHLIDTWGWPDDKHH